MNDYKALSMGEQIDMQKENTRLKEEIESWECKYLKELQAEKDLKEAKEFEDAHPEYVKFLTTYSGKKLLANHYLGEKGHWRIRGEDPNCELHGPHHMPELGTVQGTLKDVLEYAIKLPNFWAWGGGGEITKVQIKEIK